MLLKFPIILSSNSFFLHLLFSKLFPEMKQLNMYFLFQIAVLEVQNKSRYSTLIEKSHEPHPGSGFLVRLIIKTWCIIFHHLRVNYIAIH